MARPELAIREVLKAGARTSGMKADVGKAGVLTVNRIKVALSSPGTGRLYPRGHGKVHQASAPGQAPAVDTGVYRASWTHTVSAERDVVEVAVFADPAYLEAHDHPRLLPIFLEHGTRHILPRPHVRGSVLAVMPLIPGLVASGLVDRERAEARRQGGRG